MLCNTAISLHQMSDADQTVYVGLDMWHGEIHVANNIPALEVE